MCRLCVAVNRDAVEHQGNINSSKAGSWQGYKAASLKKEEEEELGILPTDLQCVLSKAARC